ncbi:MAG TPA: cell division protein FtsQ/DivIB [Steroidobacteraceae bacterium]|nr:cell division protein FtsQ/DivIB [Steroidobacteraceae bacterium]
MSLRRGKTATRNRRREQSRPWLRNRLQTMRRLAPAAAVVLTLAGALFLLRLSLDKPVERVAISGRFQRVQPLEVEKAVRAAVADEGMVSVDLAQIAHAVEQIPWVDRASVARSWPRALTVQVVEQAPVARWGEGGLVNLRGEVFVHDSRHVPPELAELVGPDGQQGLMTERYLAAAPRLTEAGMRLTRLTLDARGAWELTLDNGVTLRLGREHIDERFERFMRAAARIVAARAVEIAYVDLRYANGFAVGWRAGAGGARRG